MRRVAQVDEFACALVHINVGILLEQHQHRGLLHHQWRQVRMRVQFCAHGHIGADQLAHAAQDVAFAIVIAIGDHGAVQAQQHHVHRQRGAQVRQQFITQGFVGGARGDAARLRRRDQPFHHRPAVFLGTLARHP
ncbi:hypothetical protein D3C72_1369340 [compost metagenome]